MTRLRPPSGTSGSGAYAQDHGGIYIPAGWGSFWQAARANSGGSLARVAVVGDSIARGYYASDLLTKGWVGLLRQRLQTAYGDGGSGWRGSSLSTPGGLSASYTAPVVTTGTWTNAGAKDGPGSCAIASTVDASTATYIVSGTTVDLYYLANGPLGQFSWTLDGVSQGTINTATGGLNVLKVTASGLANASHTVVVTKVGTTNVWIFGARGYNAAGVVVDNYGYPGKASTQFDNTGALNTVTAAGRWSGGQYLPADLVIYELAANDAGSNIVPDTYIKSVRTYLDGVRDAGAVNGAVDLMFVLPHLGTFEGASKYGSDYAIRLRALASHYGAAFVDLWTVYRNSNAYFTSLNGFGNSASPGATGTDAVHPSDTGHALYEGVIGPLLTA